MNSKQASDRVGQLGYLGIDASDTAAWERFANEVLGLQSNGAGPDGALYLKMDENHHRITLHPGERDDVAYCGWEVADAASARAVAKRLRAQGARVTECTEAQARARGVEGLVSVRDPNGVANEIYWGPMRERESAFVSPRGVRGFRTGELGFGHIVLAVDDYDQSLRFYRDGLGLLVSDYLELDMGAGEKTTVAFLHSSPRHHSLAIVQFPAERRLHHFMLQVNDLDDVGTALDLCRDRGVPIATSLGRHTLDLTTSFYMTTPSGFLVEYGQGGLEIDDSTWQVQTYDEASIWGHRSEPTQAAAETPASAEAPAAAAARAAVEA